MSRLLFLNACYAPDSAATGQYFRDLAVGMSARGHSVAIVAANSAYAAGSSGATWPPREELERVEVWRVDAGADHGPGLISRAWRFLRLQGKLFVKALALPRPDVIISGTSPPYLPVVAALLGILKRTPVVFWLLDNFPDAAEAVGMLKPRGLLAHALDLPMRFAFALAQRRVVIGRCMQTRLARFETGRVRFEFVPLWPLAGASLGAATPSAVSAMRTQLGAEPGQYLAVYSGNLGRGHDIEKLEELVVESVKNPGLAFAFVGTGFGFERLKRLVESQGLPRCTFQAPVPRAQLAALLQAADLHLVALSARASGSMVPSKFYGVIGAQRPCLFVGPKDSEIGRVIIEEKAGLVFDGVDALICAEALAGLVTNKVMRATFEAGAARAAARFSYDKMMARWGALIAEVTGGSAPGS